MSTPFEMHLQEFANHKGIQISESAYGLEFECEGHSVLLVEHPLHDDQLLAEVSVTLLDPHPPAQQLALLLQINEAARFEHEWTIVLDTDQQVSLSTSVGLQNLSVAGLEALMLDGIERAQVLNRLLAELLQMPMGHDKTAEAAAPHAMDNMVIRG